MQSSPRARLPLPSPRAGVRPGSPLPSEPPAAAWEPPGGMDAAFIAFLEHQRRHLQQALERSGSAHTPRVAASDVGGAGRVQRAEEAVSPR